MTKRNPGSVVSKGSLFAGLLVLAAQLAGCSVAGVEDDRSASEEGAIVEAAEAKDEEAMPSLAVDRVWAEPGMGYGYAMVTLTNDTGASFDSAVRVRCDALNADGEQIGSHRGGFFASEHGLMAPGFTGTMKVSVPLEGNGLDDMSCIVEWAR